jgi:lipoprotein-anchoring transpeptidase ErfK/SrfK
VLLAPHRLQRPRAGGVAARSWCPWRKRGSATLTMRTRRFGLALAGLVLFAATSTGAAPAHSLVPAFVKPTQELAALRSAHRAFSKPDRDSALLRRVQARRPLTGERTVLPVLGHRTGADGLAWLHVRLPGRPTGRTGWIRQRATVASTTSWHIVVDTSRRLVIVYRNGRPMRIVKAVVGKPTTPTPLGEFFVEEAIALQDVDVGAPFALALSARADVLQEFQGGPGQIALHGLTNVGGVLGTAASHGCVRLDNSTMHWLVVRIGPGVPVTITG